jgi:nucleotide-binding universal stress UspA family protein
MAAYKNILIPLDGSECSERALEEGRTLAQAFGSSVTLMYVVSDPDFDCSMGSPMIMTDSLKADVSEAHDYLDKRAAGFTTPVKTTVQVGCVSKTIVAEAERGGYDLLVMGSQGLGSPVRRFFLGSVTKRILLDVRVPVLVVR